MWRFRRSGLSAFGLGLFWAAVGGAALITIHHSWAPPSSDETPLAAVEDLREEGSATATGAGRWSRSVAQVTVDVKPEAAAEPVLRNGPVRIFRQNADIEAQRTLIRGIQSELKRVGCYVGSVDGSWSDSTQQAMQQFNSVINTKLPTGAPDYILLTMLQGHRTGACAAEPGTLVAEPRRVVRRPGKMEDKVGEKAGDAATDGWTSTIVTAPTLRPSEPLAPAARQAAQPEPRVIASPAASPIAPSAGQFRATLATDLPPSVLPTPHGQAIPPGRMAVGAPIEAPTVMPSAGDQPQPVAAPQPVPRAPAPVQATRRANNNGGGGNSGGGRANAGSASSSPQRAFVELGRNAP